LTAYSGFSSNLSLQFADIFDETNKILNLLPRVVHNGIRKDITTLAPKANNLIDHILSWQQIHPKTPVLETLQRQYSKIVKERERFNRD